MVFLKIWCCSLAIGNNESSKHAIDTDSSASITDLQHFPSDATQHHAEGQEHHVHHTLIIHSYLCGHK